MVKIKEAWFVSRDGRDFTGTHFKSKDLADKGTLKPARVRPFKKLRLSMVVQFE